MDILSILKVKETSLDNLSRKLKKSYEEIRTHVCKLEREGLIKQGSDDLFEKFLYDEIRIEV